MWLDVRLDLFPLMAAVLAAVSCGLLGNYLVLRRLSLMGDAISHSVLPGLVIAFLVTSVRTPIPMFIGAAAAGIVTVVLVELVKRFGRVEPGAAMGVVFTVLFALGVLLIEVAGSANIDLDADCVLHGQLETLVWYDGPDTWAEVLQWSTLSAAPRQVVGLAITAVVAVLFVLALYKELRIAAFDPAMATTQGFSATALHFGLMLVVAGATVAAFEAVGAILVIAMLVCPAATARLLTDRLGTQLLLSVVVAIICGLGGYWAATSIPEFWQKDSLNAAGSMAVMGGITVVAAMVFSPRHGLLSRWLRRRANARAVRLDDLLAAMYRAEELSKPTTDACLASHRRSSFGNATVRRAIRRGLTEQQGEHLRMTEQGRTFAAGVLRRHRLWERYLVDDVGLAGDHVHETAERLEHLSPQPPAGAATDPHGKPVPDAGHSDDHHR